ncbi:MAG: DUF3090 family protein [Desertimonas sp.]
MTVFYEFDEVDSFAAVTVGQPGARVFYLQARRGADRVTVRCEKQQVGAIAQYLRRVLSDLPPPDSRPLPDTVDPRGADRSEAFVLGPIGLGYDRSNDRLLVQLDELIPSDLADENETAHDPDAALDRSRVRLYVTREQAALFCEHADHLVAAGRPSCSWCGLPIDPGGHRCPRMN